MATRVSHNFLHVLVDPKYPNVDIIAVHGLNITNTNHHAEAAWTSNDKLWLRDFLPSSLPNARVLLFGYNANVAFETSTAGVLEQAKNLLNLIALKRLDDKNRPIVFVAHSLGGIIVKRALVEAELDRSYKVIRTATYGIAFFGTPHRGGRNVKLGAFAASLARSSWGPSNTFLEVLKKDSLFADSLHSDFQHQLEDYKILSFYETRPMGIFGLVVEKDSATLGLAGTRETQVLMNTNHAELCKFATPGGDLYKQVASNIVELVRYAVKKAASSFLAAMDETDRQCLRALRATDPRHEKSRIEATRDALLEDSCSWIFKDSAYLTWWDDFDCPILWVHGDPGKGKTMMMMAIIQEIRSRLESQKSRPGFLSYFFCQKTDERLNTTAAVLRGLIFMLVCQRPALISYLRKKYDEAGGEFLQGPTTVYTLLDVLFEILEDQSLPPVYLMIDALDECDTKIVQLIERITREKYLFIKVKWIMTSRNEPIFKQRLERDGHLHTSLELNSIHVSRAVENFIDCKVNDLTRRNEYPRELSLFVKASLVQKADGTFLWVALVCKALNDVATWKTKSVLQKFPAGLEPLYDRMMEQLYTEDEDTEMYEGILRSVTLALRPLHLAEIPFFARLPEELQGDLQALTDLIDRCGSFLTVRQDTVYFVHQSAKDYFSTGQGVGKRIFPAGQLVEHGKITYTCFKIMTDTLKKDMCHLQIPGTMIDEVDAGTVDQCVPLYTRYACVYWLDHLQESSDECFFRGGDPVVLFCQQCLLYWLEMLSLIREFPRGLLMIRKLETLLNTYVSALAFSPNRSLVKECYSSHLPKWLYRSPQVAGKWTPSLQTLEGHMQGVERVVFSSDSRLMASSSYDGTVWLWDVSTGTVQYTFIGHTKIVNTMEFSPNNQLLASGSADDTIRLWDCNTGDLRGILNDHTDEVLIVKFSPDGKSLASSSRDRTVRLWDPKTGEVGCTFDGHAAAWEFWTITFSSSGQLLASSYDQSTVQLWDCSAGKLQHTLEGRIGAVNAITFSSNGQFLACGFYDGRIQLWDCETGKLWHTLQEYADHFYKVSSLAFSPDGQLLAAGYYDGIVRLWNSNTGELCGLFDDSAVINIIAFSCDCQLLASGTGYGTVRLWDIHAGEMRSTLTGHTDPVRSIVFSPDGQLLASASDDGTIRLWDLDMSEMTDVPERWDDDIKAVTFSPDGQVVAFGSTIDAIRLLNSHTSETQFTLKDPLNEPVWGEVSSLVFSPNGQVLASTNEDGLLRLWKSDTGELCATMLGHCGFEPAIEFSPDSELLASGSLDCTVRLWNSSTAELCGSLEGHTGAIEAVAFSYDGQLLASGSRDKTIRLWDSRTHKLSGILEGHTDCVEAVAFSHNGELLASSSADVTIRLWDPSTEEVRGILLVDYTYRITSIAFSGDSRLLASGSYDKIWLWDLHTKTQVREFDDLYIHRMTFSSNASCLVTSSGTIPLEPLPHGNQKRPSAFKCWRLQSNWFHCNDHRALWLPPEFRPARKRIRRGWKYLIEARDNIFALGLPSGQMGFFEFDPDPKFRG